MNKKKNKDLRIRIISCEANLLRNYENRYDGLVDNEKEILVGLEKGSFGYDALRRLLKRLEEYKHSYILFMQDYEVLFTNNEVERDLCH